MWRKKDNRGSALIVVIIVIAFVSILVSTLFAVTVANIQMKSVDRKAKDNFYSAEGALDQINLGLQGEISKAAIVAYEKVMQNYATNTLEVERRRIFNESFVGTLKNQVDSAEGINKYSKELLESYLSDEVKLHTALDSTAEYMLVKQEDGVILKGLVVTYTDDENFQSIIETDILLSAPDMNLIHPSDMPDLFEYCIVANKELLGDASGTVSIGANVYAGTGGLTLDQGARWNFNQANRMVVNGEVSIPRTASMNFATDMDLWAGELLVSGGTLNTLGRTYVANDLVMSDRGSSVTLAGEYYGYGNGELLTDAGVTLNAGGDSSAILINGTNTSLDMSKVRKLLLSGSAQIATGKLAFDKDEIESLLPENDPSLDTKVQPAVLGSGAYSLLSVGNGMLVCSEAEYLRARTNANAEVGENSWERFLLMNNSDGTVSLKDRNLDRYVGVVPGDPSALRASADAIGVNEKFYLYQIQGRVGQYALKSYANGKYVTVDTFYDNVGGRIEYALCANREKVTDDYQLFQISRVGDLPVVPVIYNPVVTFTYENTSVVQIAFADPSWEKNTAASPCSATISYSLYNVDVTKEMTLSEKHRKATYRISNINEGETINYTITYTNPDRTEHMISGTYTHMASQGNSGDGKVLEGVYSWRVSSAYTNGSNYCQVTDYGNGRLQFSANGIADNDTSWEKFIMVNNYDGTMSIKSIVNQKYVSIQPNGSLIANSDTIGINEKFKLLYIGRDYAWYYQLKTLEGSLGGGQYVCANFNENGWPLILKPTIDGWEDHFYFEWMEYTNEKGEQPPIIEPETPNHNPVTSMKYYDETSAKASFTSPYWDGGADERVTIYYRINGGSLHEAAMDKAGTEATYIVPGLKNKDKVSYYFTYTYQEVSGAVQTATTASAVYIHETKYGDAVHVDDKNENINLGESLEVKSNQLAYLIPAECIGVNKGETLIGSNPMTAAEFTQMMSYANNATQYPDFEVVSFTKEVAGLGGSLDQYRSPGTEGYRTIFVQSAEGTMVYFYVDFDSDNASKYFRDYYAKNQSAMERYMNKYVSKISLNGLFTRLTTDGNMVYSASGSSGSIYLKSNEGYGAYLSETEKNAQKNEETGYQKRYKALCSKLVLDYAELTQPEKAKELFDNLIRYSESGEADSFAFAGMAQSSIPIEYSTFDAEGNPIKALVLNNKNSGEYRYNGDPDQQVCMILATGDVTLEQDFSGIVIARGTVKVADNFVNNIVGDKENLYQILQTKINPADETSKTIIEHYFRDGERYIFEGSAGDAEEERGEYISYAKLVSYQNWTKK